MIVNLGHNPVLHETTVVLSVVTGRRAAGRGRRSVQKSPITVAGVYEMVLTFGYMDTHDVVGELHDRDSPAASIDLGDTTFFLGRETVTSIPRGDMPRWRRNSSSARPRNSQHVALYQCLASKCSRSGRRSRSEPTQAHVRGWQGGRCRGVGRMGAEVDLALEGGDDGVGEVQAVQPLA